MPHFIAEYTDNLEQQADLPGLPGTQAPAEEPADEPAAPPAEPATP